VPQKLSVVIACGGTGGHLFPGIAVAEELKRRGHLPLLLISRKKVDADASAKYGTLDFRTVAAIAKPPTLSPKMLPFLWQLWRTIRQSKRLLREHRAEVVLGMGGFTSLPPVYAGKKMGLVTALHDSNALPGKSNRMGARWCSKILVGLEAARGYFPGGEVEVTGTPVRREFGSLPSRAEARTALGLSVDQPVVFSFGGSQGARGLNTLVAEAAEILGEGVQWLQVAGRDDEQRVKELAAGRNGHVVHGFCDDMPAAYAASDLVISRAGGASLTELAFLGLPSILVPYPHAADDHQTHNARCFEQAGAALMAPECELGGAKLAKLIGELLESPKKLDVMKLAARELSVDDAAGRICDILLPG
jgi:UDP-N-acetylglucosamine--N-acetylmuramyl-(pentapeptide) pyrophosphoryl-undecaprenol N-acetylglucosamine transferase|tara:strand:- start:4452 stop:5537 length:1086 start_codon:yes stop_codon:yes gene_type:complete